MWDLDYEADAQAEEKYESVQQKIEGAYEALLYSAVNEFAKKLRQDLNLSYDCILESLHAEIDNHLHIPFYKKEVL
jgi:uncharacterized radical SAM superfamily Fe-S cluster-containing enzyme